MITFRVPIEALVLKPNVSAGCNPLVLMSLAYEMRSTSNDPEPVLVRQEGAIWRVIDGRHRFMAAVIAGRRDVLVTEVEA